MVEGVTVRFGGLEALDDVSLKVRRGSTHAVIGPNGAGKSTLLNVLTGVYRASSGTVRYGDDVLTGLRPPRIAALGVSRTFQNLALSPQMTVRDNLLLGRHRLTKAGFVSAGLRLPRRPPRGGRAGARSSAGSPELLDLTDKLERPVGALPYGDRKRVELARALCAEPSLLLLDEPVAGMNADETQRMADAIVRLREALGISILLVEHDMRFVMGLAEHVTVLDFGRRHRRRHAGAGPGRPAGARGLSRQPAPEPTRSPREPGLRAARERPLARLHLRADRDGLRDRLQGDQRRQLRPRVGR